MPSFLPYKTLEHRPVGFISLADDGLGRRTGFVLPMEATETCHPLCDKDWHCGLITTCSNLPPSKTFLGACTQTCQAHKAAANGPRRRTCIVLPMAAN